MLVGTARILIAQGGELSLGRIRCQADGVRAHGRYAGEQRAVEQLGMQLMDLHGHAAYFVFQLLRAGFHPLGQITRGAGEPGQQLQISFRR